MRFRLRLLAAGMILAAGCGKTNPDTAPASPEDEKAAEQRIKEEAGREGKARQQERKENRSEDD